MLIADEKGGLRRIRLSSVCRRVSRRGRILGLLSRAPARRDSSARPLDEQTVVGKPRLQSLGIVSDLTTKHAFAGSAGQRKFDALPEVIALPQRQDLEMLAVVGEAADEGIKKAKRQRETASK